MKQNTRNFSRLIGSIILTCVVAGVYGSIAEKRIIMKMNARARDEVARWLSLFETASRSCDPDFVVNMIQDVSRHQGILYDHDRPELELMLFSKWDNSIKQALKE